MKLLKLSILLSLVVLINSCTIHLVPAKDQNVLDKVTLALGQTNTLYKDIQINSDKSYQTYAVQYSVIDDEINSIISIDVTRPKGKIVTGMMNDIKERFARYEAYHKTKDLLNNSEALVFQEQMQALWSAVFNSEINFK